MSDTILIGEDEPLQRQMLSMMLGKKLGYKVIAAEDGEQAVRHVKASNVGDIAAVLLDLDMPQMNGFETLKVLRQYRPDLPVLILTARDDTAAAVRAVKEGASDFIVKPASPEQLDVALKNAIRLSALSRELTRLRRDRDGAMGFADLIGHDGGLAQAVNYARKAAASDVPVLLTGEISTGKELLARAIHGESRRIGAPFVAVQCAAVPAASLENLLFGVAAGLSRPQPGKVREAERGTLFLDDVHALPPGAQARLLRLLQRHELETPGNDRPMKVNVRVIAASDRDLHGEVRAGRMREELYFALNVLPVHLPALRERAQDILPLADYFLRRIASLDGLPPRPLTADARRYLADYRWPGNLREMEGLLRRALVLCEGEAIDRALLGRIHLAEAPAASPMGEHIALMHASGLPKSMAEIEAEAMRKTLERCGGNITRAAEALGMAKSTFYRKAAVKTH